MAAYRTVVRLGVTMFATDVSMAVPELAVEAEARGLTSLFLPEHTHIPVSRRTPAPTGAAELAEEYRRTVDPFVVLAAAAARTDTIRLGTGICLVAQREPIVTAKAVATLDALSGGRFDFGIGFGWNREEMTDHGVDPATRRAVAREHVLAMRALWRDDVATFEGDYVRFEASWSWPKPVQPGGPPVLLGGAAGPTLFAHVAEYADGWLPIGGAGIRAALPALAAACETVGRDPASVRVVPFGTMPDEGKLEYYASLGIDEVVLRLPTAPRDVVTPILDRYAPLVARAAGITAAR
jgi:probable F420-dependent oxidoreductase